MHERRLEPGLANPNKEEKLNELIEMDRRRFEEAAELGKQDRAEMCLCLRSQADAFVQATSTNFEAAVRLVDALPLHIHFKKLPGDDQVEPPRMSIKRRMRRMSAYGAPNSKEAPEDGGLPARNWPGLPLNELRQLMTDDWPLDERIAAEPETPPPEKMVSFRSIVHKQLFRQRGVHYERYKEAFTAEVRQRNTELLSREERERVGDRNWQAMVHQLRGEVPPVDAQVEGPLP